MGGKSRAAPARAPTPTSPLPFLTCPPGSLEDAAWRSERSLRAAGRSPAGPLSLGAVRGRPSPDLPPHTPARAGLCRLFPGWVCSDPPGRGPCLPGAVGWGR